MCLPEWRNLPAGRQVVVALDSSMTYTVYALKSRHRHIIYVGMTSDDAKRLTAHNAGRNRSTKAYRPFDLFYSEICQSRAEARKKEKYFKSGIGKEKLKKILAGVA